MGNNSINDAFKELESMSNQIKINKNKLKARMLTMTSIMNWILLAENEMNELPTRWCFFNDTGNPFLGIMHFLQRKPIPPKTD